jgi:hypothetical protein
LTSDGGEQRSASDLGAFGRNARAGNSRRVTCHGRTAQDDDHRENDLYVLHVVYYDLQTLQKRNDHRFSLSAMKNDAIILLEGVALLS